MEKEKYNEEHYYHLLGGDDAKGPTHFAEEAVKEAYKTQLNSIKKKYGKTTNPQGFSSSSFFRPEPRTGEGLLRIKDFVIGFKEIYVGNRGEDMKWLYVEDKDEYRIFRYAEPCKNPLGYKFGLSIKFPEGKKSIVTDSEKDKTIPINSKNLENKLRGIGLNPSLVKKSITKYNKEKTKKEDVYEIYFNYELSEDEIEELRMLSKEYNERKFREGISKPLEDAVNYILNLELN